MENAWWVTLLLGPLLAIAGIMLLISWLTNQTSEWLIGRKHRLIEEIVNRGEVPYAWRAESARRARGAGRAQGDAIQARAKTDCLRRLDALIAYVENSPLMGDEETKEVVLQRLDEVYDDWASREPATFTAGSLAPGNRTTAVSLPPTG